MTIVYQEKDFPKHLYAKLLFNCLILLKYLLHTELANSKDHHKPHNIKPSLIIIRSIRNTFIIRNENKHKSSLYLVAKFRKCQCKLTSVAGRYNSCTLQVSTESFTDSPGERVYKRIFQVSGFNRQTKKYFFLTSILLKTGLKYNNLTSLNQCI